MNKGTRPKTHRKLLAEPTSRLGRERCQSTEQQPQYRSLFFSPLLSEPQNRGWREARIRRLPQHGQGGVEAAQQEQEGEGNGLPPRLRDEDGVHGGFFDEGDFGR